MRGAIQWLKSAKNKNKEGIYSEPFIIHPNEIYLAIISTENCKNSELNRCDAMFQYVQKDDNINCYFFLQGFGGYADGIMKASALIFHI